jgi:hypothetical protein
MAWLGTVPPVMEELVFRISLGTLISLDHLPRINQRREVEADNIHLQFDSVGVVNHGANNGILSFPVMKVHADFVADVEFVFWFFGWHGRNVRLTEIIRNSGVNLLLVRWLFSATEFDGVLKCLCESRRVLGCAEPKSAGS